MQQLVYGFALLKPGQRPMLPEDRSYVAGSVAQPFMPYLQSSVAQFQSFVKYLPEFIHIPLGRERYIRQIYSHNPLVKPAVIFALTLNVIFSVRNIAQAHRPVGS